MGLERLWYGLIRPVASIPVSVIIGDKCASEILNFTYVDYECHKKFLSRCIGIVILVGSAFIKLPQIIKIMAAGSAKGLCPQTYLLELVFLSLYASFNYRNGSHPILYGETVFVMIQNIIILLYIMKTHKRSRYLKLCLILNPLLFLALCSPKFTSLSTISMLQPVSVASAVSSKLPQILTNYKQKSTGQLSALTVIAQTGGAVARTITTYIETASIMLVICNISNFILSTIILLQIVLYYDGQQNEPSGEVGPMHKPKASKKSKVH